MISNLKLIVAGLWTNNIISSCIIGLPKDYPNITTLLLNIPWWSENQYNNKIRVEFRLVWNIWESIEVLENKMIEIKNYLKTNYESLWFYNFEISNYYVDYDPMWRPFVLNDFIFNKQL
jgi:hypothetical protein